MKVTYNSKTNRFSLRNLTEDEANAILRSFSIVVEKMGYIYYTMKGYRGTGGFTLNRAYYLLKTGALKLK